MDIITVIIADDHEIVRDGISLLFEGTPDIEMIDTVAGGAEFTHQIRCQREGIVIRFKIGDLRTDMQIDADGLEMGCGGDFGINLQRSPEGNAELVLCLAG